MQCHPSLYYVMYLGTLLFVVQFNVFISFIIYCLLTFLVMQHIPNRVTFERNIQKSVPRALQL